jgi:HlyD family secretion protein
MIKEPSSQNNVIVSPTRAGYKRYAIWGGAAVVAVVALALLMNAWRGSSASVSAARLRIAAVTKGTLVRDASVNGRVVAAISPTLYAAAAGTVTLKVNAGDTVKQGQILAIVESPDLTDQLKREQSSTEQLEAEVARQQILAKKQKLIARRDADTAEIERASAKLTFERIEAAGKLGVVPKNDYQRAEDAVRSTEIRARHAEQAALLENDDVVLELKTKVSQLQRQRLSLDYARRRVEELKLRAPVDGLIGSIAVADRSVVPANTAVLTVVDLSRLEIELDIPESYVADLGLGMTAEIVAGDIKANGKLSAISPEVLNNQVLARVRFNGNQPAGLRQSQRVAAHLLIEEKPNVVLLPRGPFVENEGGKFVYVVENGVARRRPVRLGATSVSAVEILEGLKPGDQVVISGSDAFARAESVSINN